MGRDAFISIFSQSLQHFYSHALVGRDKTYQKTFCFLDDFYSHALVGRDKTIKGNCGRCGFYSHALVGRDPCRRREQEALSCFYSHALVGRDGIHTGGIQLSLPVSTHTPSWGVTVMGMDTRMWQKFLLTRPRGA